MIMRRCYNWFLIDAWRINRLYIDGRIHRIMILLIGWTVCNFLFKVADLYSTFVKMSIKVKDKFFWEINRIWVNAYIFIFRSLNSYFDTINRHGVNMNKAVLASVFEKYFAVYGCNAMHKYVSNSLDYLQFVIDWNFIYYVINALLILISFN